jgi:hypothetical protein
MEARDAAAGGADAFIGFGGNAVRDAVRAGADWFVRSFGELTGALTAGETRVDATARLRWTQTCRGGSWTLTAGETAGASGAPPAFAELPLCGWATVEVARQAVQELVGREGSVAAAAAGLLQAAVP